MKKPLILAALLSATAALAACDRSDDPASMTGNPGATDNSVTMPSPAPQGTAPMADPAVPSPGAGAGTGTESQ